MSILLKIKNITKNYGARQVLKGIDLDIFQGEILSLLGINGAGKTTLSSIIATLHPPTDGDIEYNGISIYQNLPAFREKIGYCPQKPNLNQHLTLRENLFVAGRYYGLSKDTIEKRLQELAQRFDLINYLDLEAGILSGGYQQRFMIARSLLHNPEFIILDEPTVGLDPHIRRNLWTLIKDLQHDGITILLTTHYLDEAEKLSDRVCILDQGTIKLIDTPDKLLKDFELNNLEDVFIELLKAGQE